MYYLVDLKENKTIPFNSKLDLLCYFSRNTAALPWTGTGSGVVHNGEEPSLLYPTDSSRCGHRVRPLGVSCACRRARSQTKIPRLFSVEKTVWLR